MADATPTASGSASSLFGGSDAIVQILLWQVAGQLIAPVLAPVGQAIANLVWSAAQVVPGTPAHVPLSPAELALAVLRGDLDLGTATGMAAESGTRGDDFATMIQNTGEPISTEQALELFRRGLIDQDCLELQIRQSRVRDQWIPQIIQLQYEPMSASDAVDAAVQNQLTFEQAQAAATVAGLLPTDFQTLVNTRGRPPGPSELIELVRRGIIPQTGTGPDALSLQQGIDESAVKDKWVVAYKALLEYMPPPRTVTALERQGVITPAQAQQMYQAAGLTPQLAAIYSQSATTTKLASQRSITEGQVLTMYEDLYLTAAEATSFLTALGYTSQEVETLLAFKDFQRALKVLNNGISKIQSQFISRHIGVTTAVNALNALGIPGEQQELLMAAWETERAVKAPVLTATQIADAVKYNVIDGTTGIQLMVDLGYQPWEGWLVLSAAAEVALPDAPPGPPATGQLP